MRTKSFLLGFILLSLIVFSTTVQAATYNIGIADGDVYIWEIKTVDEDLIDEVFDDDPDDVFPDADKVGERSKTEITKLEEDDDDWEIEVDVWEYTDDPTDFDGKADDDTDIDVLGDPDDVDEIDTVADAMLLAMIIPVPAIEYLAALDWDKDWTVEGDRASREVEGPEEDYMVYLRWDASKGILNNMKQTNMDGHVFYEIGIISTTIPGYDLPFFLVFAALSAIGLIYLVMKKK